MLAWFLRLRTASLAPAKAPLLSPSAFSTVACFDFWHTLGRRCVCFLSARPLILLDGIPLTNCLPQGLSKQRDMVHGKPPWPRLRLHLHVLAGRVALAVAIGGLLGYRRTLLVHLLVCFLKNPSCQAAGGGNGWALEMACANLS